LSTFLKLFLDTQPGARIGILSSGSADPAVTEARDLLAQKGIATDYLRIRSLPFGEEVQQFLESHEKIFVVEINRDGQMLQLLTIKYPQYAGKMIKAAHMDGLPITAKWVCGQIMTKEEK
jgi:2-oxoglutarate ferredoxin oxidoreductase subunit alpha